MKTNVRDEYLIVCRTEGEALYLLTRLATYLNDRYMTGLRIRKHHLSITAIDPQLRIRFVSKAKAYEACRGFHGTIKTAYEVDKFLAPLERERAEYEITSRFYQVL